jgi:hypothetical protein
LAEEIELKEMAQSNGKKMTDLETFNKQYQLKLERQAARKRELQQRIQAQELEQTPFTP